MTADFREEVGREEKSNSELTLTITMIRLLKPFEVKGDEECASIINVLAEKLISPAAIKWRIKHGYYKEGIHFRNGGKMRLWNREAIIRSELNKREERGYEAIH